MQVNQQHLPHDEQLLIRACIAGDRTSQSKLYDLYAPKMLVVCIRYTKDRQEAEEIMQEGFMRVFTYLKQFKGEGSFEGWIRKIMVNCSLARYRNTVQFAPVVELNTGNNSAADSRDILSDISAKELLNLIQTLTPAYRIVFNLYVFEGMKHREIAELLGISEGTSKSNLSDARIMLQKALKKKDNIPGHKQIAYG